MIRFSKLLLPSMVLVTVLIAVADPWAATLLALGFAAGRVTDDAGPRQPSLPG